MLRAVRVPRLASASWPFGRPSSGLLALALALPLALPPGLAGAAALTACGPSFQVVYEGNARFEHCYALDESSQASMPAKASCWRDWSEHYTYGQTRDRVLYATARYVALSEARALPTDEAMMNAAPGESRQSAITAPAPTNAFAPPPKVLEPTADPQPPQALPANEKTKDSAPPAAPPPPPAPNLPAASCAEECGSTFRGCTVGCPADAGAKASKSCRRCQPAYRACMRACFK